MTKSLNVSVSTGVRTTSRSVPTGNLTGGATPSVWIGGEAPGGLTLPPAEPKPNQLYAPRGVWLDDDFLIVADTGNHRVLIWSGTDSLASHCDASVVLGQPDFVTEGAQAGGRGPAKGMRLPTGILVHEGSLVVADAWNHRLLIWNRVPTESDTAPDRIVGQPDNQSVEENRGGNCSADSFYWPFGIAFVDDRFWVCDTGNRRVLAWDGLPEPGQPPSLILGQPDALSRDENRGAIAADSFRWPHDVAGTGELMFVADAGNHRLLGWSPPPSGDSEASLLLGQPDFESCREFPYDPQSPTTMRFPYAIDITDDTMVVADTANNRILIWDEVPIDSNEPADRVLGQPDWASMGENRWDCVASDSFCWPYGLAQHKGRLVVSDSGNNRVMIWDLG